MDKKNQITEGVIWIQLLIFFFPIMVGTLFQTIVQYGRCDHRRTLCREAGSCKCRRICGSADKLCHWIFHRIIRGSHCHHFPILRGEKLETIEQRTSHCICLFYHSKYFNLRHWLVFYSCSSAPFEDTCGCHTGFYSVS